MSLLTNRRTLPAVLVVCATLLSACEGESRPFQESVEVQTLGLTAIRVDPPANSQEGLFINSGQTLQLALTGITDTGTEVLLPASERLWSTSDPSVFTVNDNGLLAGVGTTQGTAEVSVLVGGIQSAPLSITVSDATLMAILSIESPDDTDALERCLPGEYFAVGRFTDDSVRTLPSVTFTVSNESVGTLVQPDAATAIVNATGLATELLTLTAQAPGAPALSRNVSILNTLQSIAISPGLAIVDEGDSLDFTANGTYNVVSEVGVEGGAPPTPDALTGTRQADITANVEWEVTSGATSASVENSGESKGRLTGLAQGTATLQARCGTSPAPAVVNVTINEEATSMSGSLSFNIDRSDDVLELALNETREILVSRGTEFDPDNLETVDDLEFEIENLGATELTIDETALEIGRIRPLAQGARVRVRARLLNEDRTVAAEGSFIVQVL